jgi:hypothetical protein
MNSSVRRCMKEPFFEVSLEEDDRGDSEAEAAEREGETGDQPGESNEDRAGNGSTEADIGDDGDGADDTLVDDEVDLHYIPGWVFDLYTALGGGHIGRHRLRRSDRGLERC